MDLRDWLFAGIALSQGLIWTALAIDKWVHRVDYGAIELTASVQALVRAMAEVEASVRAVRQDLLIKSAEAEGQHRQYDRYEAMIHDLDVRIRHVESVR